MNALSLGISGKPLTRTEKTVLHYLSMGLTSEQIAGQLFVAKSTVDKHRKNMLKKLGVKNTAQMIVFAAERAKA